MESLSRYIRQLSYASLEGLRTFWRSGWMSWIVISTMVVSLSVLGGFWLIVNDINYISNSISSKLQIMVFLNNQISIEEIAPKIERLEGVVKIEKIPKEQAWEEMKKNMKDMDFNNLIDNPLPDTIEVSVNNTESIEPIVNQITQLPGVEDVKYNQELVIKLKEIKNTLKLIGISITTILTIATIAIIINTIRLAIYSYKDEIEIMRLVGGPDWFVSFPFILEGILFGIISGILTSIVLIIWRFFSIDQINKLFPFLPLQDDPVIVWKISIWLFFIGMVVGVIGSFISLNRYLGFEKSTD